MSHFKDEAHIAINSLAKQQIAKETLMKYDLDSIYICGRIDTNEDNFEDIPNGI